MAVIALIVLAPAASAQPALVFASKERDCLANRNVNAFLRMNHATVMRLILSPQDGQAGAGIGCISYAHAAGFKVYISLQFNNRWSAAQVASYFRRVLPRYAPFLWAVGVGNEQDLTSPTGYGQGTGSLSGHGRTAGQGYRADLGRGRARPRKARPARDSRLRRIQPVVLRGDQARIRVRSTPRRAGDRCALLPHRGRRRDTGSTGSGVGRIQTTATLVLGDGTGASQTPHSVVGRSRHLGVLERDRREDQIAEPKSPDDRVLLLPRPLGRRFRSRPPYPPLASGSA